MKEMQQKEGIKERKKRDEGGEKSKGKERGNKSGVTYCEHPWQFRIFVKEPQFN